MQNQQITHFEAETISSKTWFSITVYPSKEGIIVICKDETERKKAEEKIESLLQTVQEDRDRYNLLLNSIPDEIWFTDKSKKVTLANPQAVKEFALDHLGTAEVEKIAGSFEVYRSDGSSRPVEEAPPLRALKGEEIKNEEEIVRTPATGQLRYRQVNAVPVKDSRGEIIWSISTVRDITEHKKAEENLRRSEQQKNDYLESVTDGFIAFDKEWRYSYVNSNAARILHKSKEELIGKVGIEVFPNASKFLEQFQKAVSSGRPVHFEEYYPQPLDIWYECHCYPTKDGLTVYFSDITERKKAEQLINQNQKTFSELVERAPFGIYIIDSQLKIAKMNKGSQNGAFRNVRPVIGRPFNEAMHILWPDHLAEEIISHFRHTLETGEPYYSPRFTSPRYDVGIVESYEWELQRIALPDGQHGVICYYFDTSKLRETERALIEAQTELKNHAVNLERLVEERTKQLKDSERLAAIGATAGMVGHDIRNPLQAMTSDVYLAKSDLDSIPDSVEKDSISESLDEIEKNIEYVNKIVQDLQDYARPLRPAARETDLEIVFNDVLIKRAIPENIDVSWKVESEAKMLIADPDLLKRILANLVNNGVQAMPTGGKLTVHAGKKSGDVIITVEDTGVGMSEEVKGRLFTPMFTTKSKGQGFGLAVVKRLTEALGGTVSFESEVGKGTKFLVRLPPPKAKR